MINRHVFSGHPSVGVNAVRWDGHDEHGVIVPPGDYVVQLWVGTGGNEMRIEEPVTIVN